MSSVDIFKFGTNGESEEFASVQNSWLSAMAIWQELAKKYIPNHQMSFTNLKPIWDLFDSNKATRNEKIVLGCTFDKVLVKRENIPVILKAFRDFKGDTNLKEQADLIEEEFKNDEDLKAIGWHQNSISCEMWFNYNVNELKEHWFLSDDLSLT